MLLIYAKATGSPKDSGNLCDWTLKPLLAQYKHLKIPVFCQIALCDQELKKDEGKFKWVGQTPTNEKKPWWRFKANNIGLLSDVSKGVGPNSGEETELGQPKALQEFLEWANSQNKNTLKDQHLIFWGHGGGWRGTVILAIQTLNMPNWLDVFINHSAKAIRVPLSLKENGATGRGDLLGDNSSLQTREIAGVVEEFFSNNEKDARLGFVGFHSCLLATIEVAYDLRKSAKYVLASPDFVYYNEVPYADWLIESTTGSASSAPEFCLPLFQLLNVKKGPASFFLIDLGKVEAIKEAVDKFCSAVQMLTPSDAVELRKSIVSTRNSAYTFGGEYSRTVDLGQFFNALAATSDKFPTIQRAALSVEHTARASIVMNCRYLNNAIAALTPPIAGIAIFFPATKSDASKTIGFDDGWYDPKGDGSASTFIDESCWRSFLDWYWDETSTIKCP